MFGIPRESLVLVLEYKYDTDLPAYSDTGYSDNLATVTLLAFPKLGI